VLFPIAHTLSALAAGELRCGQLVDSCLAAIADTSGEGARAFIRTFPDSARTAAANFDSHRPPGPLGGLPISIKDLFDVAGETTLAGSLVLAGAPAAKVDALAVSRLRAAGAVLVGRTNMTEFAFSALGLNPHHGTPCNPYDRPGKRIPGGSSSGAAVSVSDGMAHAAIGSDTGGSVRIPAALCGLTGFKPTARRVPLDGALPLSSSLDSIGPIAPTVACCGLIDAVLAGADPQPLLPAVLPGLRLGVLQGYVLNELDASVSAAFDSALSLLSRSGAHLEDVTFPSLHEIPHANRTGGFAAAEAYAWHRPLMEKHAARYDPRVLSRIMVGEGMTAAEYIELMQARQQIRAAAVEIFAKYDAILAPTVPRIAPPIAEVAATDVAYFEANAAMLRNTSVINFLDGCALSVPCHMPGEAPVGLMIAGSAMQDERILSIGAAIESALATGGCAIHHQVHSTTVA
jgi:aspartyl-tRNA(Asn)/glutamyl-tRNA(Gln) amidotransferase subunit A